MPGPQPTGPGGRPGQPDTERGRGDRRTPRRLTEDSESRLGAVERATQVERDSEGRERWGEDHSDGTVCGVGVLPVWGSPYPPSTSGSHHGLVEEIL